MFEIIGAWLLSLFFDRYGTTKPHWREEDRHPLPENEWLPGHGPQATVVYSDGLDDYALPRSPLWAGPPYQAGRFQ